MPSDHSPTFRRLLLGRELRELREACGLTAEDIGKHLEVSTPWISRIENAQRGIQMRDLRRLLELYQVSETNRRERLINLARESREQGWWHAYKDVLPPRYADYIGLEASASEIRSFELVIVPGLLQTEEYARALFSGGLGEISEQEAERRVQVRMKRQELLTQDEPPRMWVILDEAVLLRSVGGSDVMRAQLTHLIEVSKLPRVTIQVIPLRFGAHVGTTGSFAILDFPHEALDPVPYIETVAGDLYLEKKTDIHTCRLVWQYLSAQAMGPRESVAMINETIRTYRDR